MKTVLNFIAVLIILSIFVSCATPKTGAPKPRDIEEHFISTGIQKYFLPDIPLWANVSHEANCKLSDLNKFLHWGNLMQSFNLSYEGSAQFQYMYNVRMKELLSLGAYKQLTLKDEELLFYDVLEKVQASIKQFNAPSYKQISVIWIDPILSLKDGEMFLSKLLAREDLSKGHPVFLSMCLSNLEMQKLLSRIELDGHDVRLIPHEMISMFNVKGELGSRFVLDLKEILGNDKTINLFVPEKKKFLMFDGYNELFYYKSFESLR